MPKLFTKPGFSLIEVLLYLSCSVGLITLFTQNYTKIEAHFRRLDKILELNDQKRFLTLYLTEHLALLPTFLPRILTDYAASTPTTQKLGYVTILHGYEYPVNLNLKQQCKGPILELRRYNLANLAEVTSTYLAIALSETTKQYSLYRIRPEHPKTEIATGINAWQIAYGVKTQNHGISYFSADEITTKKLWEAVSLLKITLFLNLDTLPASTSILIPVNYPLL